MSQISAITGKNFDSDVLKNEGVTVVRFWAAWCGPCIRMKPVYEEVANELSVSAKFTEVDIDQAPEIAGAYGIRSVPTTVVFKDGQPTDGVTGLVPKSQLTDLVKKHL
ncbi:thioredoxin [Brucella tritici]|uniref:Thioredoxin n=1 Tax=Brucella tritici TaxID=94626 RepID=A0A6L3YVB6_9HYPH|nr:thioredoxin [Brucella tritici]KAB2688476.1 thioredoxin [Brucella tritici]